MESPSGAETLSRARTSEGRQDGRRVRERRRPVGDEPREPVDVGRLVDVEGRRQEMRPEPGVPRVRAHNQRALAAYMSFLNDGTETVA